MKPQQLPCTPACGYEFNAPAVHLHPPLPQFIAPSVGSAFEIRSEDYGGETVNIFFAETVNVLRVLAVFAEELHH